MSDTFDVIVVGAGAIGENAAGRAVQGGLSVAMVEAQLIGGECSYWACMPSKALIRTPQAVHDARALPGVTASFDPAAVLARRNQFTHDWDDASQQEWAEGAGITVVRGTARLTGPKEVQLDDGRRLTATQAVVLATGSVPAEPPIDGLADTEHWGSREATSAQAVPESLVVLGSGVVGCELAQAYARLGSAVTMLVRGDRVLPKVEPAASDLVRAGLAADGVDLRFGVNLTRVHRDDDGLLLHLDDGSELRAEQLLVATGRRPATDDVGVETVGLTPGETLHVDDSGQVQGVDGDWLYACGDVTGRAPLTHQGKYDARVVGDVIAARAKGTVDAAPWSRYAATADHAAVPQVVFTDPEVAYVGRTAQETERAGIAHDVVEIDIAVGGSSLYADGYTGKAVMVVDRERQVLLGVTFAGPGVAEMLHAATIAIVGEVPLHRLWHAVPSYPTVSEVWLRLLEAYGL
ncbi:NAD(P)/FAD-dependent oxidoreductase [Rhodococcus sp. X156]|uniref:dihydrolipoyl dehydrogenase family protein n=1 Tax=Rhodococcus sp. X156 TaxID=2499145 RepID=UPI000FD85C83|nr:NAD(P)/FAD-dependent oxidoreductase [Rhodococcus sp. X156]